MPRRPGRRSAAVLAAGVGCAAASLTRPLTAEAAVAVALPAAAVLVGAARRPRPGHPRSGRPRSSPGPGRAGSDPGPGPGPTRSAVRRTALAWAVLAATVAAVELTALVRQPAWNVASPDHPTLSLLLDPLTSSGPSRWLFWCVWLGLGWLVARR